MQPLSDPRRSPEPLLPHCSNITNFVHMKKTLKYIRFWYYRRLYTQLVFAYLKHESTCCGAYNWAETAFQAITGRSYSDYLHE